MSGASLRQTGLRLGIVLLCVAAWADVRPLAGGTRVLPVAVVDVSRSLGSGPARVPDGVRVAGEWVLVADGVQVVVGGAEAGTLGRGRSDLGSALRYVAETWPGRDVLLVSDGRDTEGGGLAGARLLAARGGHLYVVPPVQPAADVGLELARLLAGGPEPRVEALVGASTSGEAEVRLVQGERVADRASVTLVPGARQSVTLADRAAPPDGGVYQVVLVPGPGTPDDDPDNDRLEVGVQPAQRVACLWGFPDGVPAAPAGLVLRARGEPRAADLAGADCVVLENLPWTQLGPERTDALERFVAGGGRALVLGGPDAWAGGGWAGTAFEERLLPLRVPREKGVGLALVLALDHSGSTRGLALAHLQDAVRQAVQSLTPDERLGILPFAGEPDARLLGPGVLREDRPAEVRAALEALDGLQAGGRTDLVAAIEAAARHAEGIQARERRVILLTDGDPDNAPDVAALEKTRAWLGAHEVRFAALVVGDAEAARRLARHLAADPADVVLLEHSRDVPARLLHRIAALRRRGSLLGRPRHLAAVGAGTLLPPLGFAPRDVQRTEAAPGSALLQVARFPAGQPADAPFAALRRVGAGQVVAVAWGPALEARQRRGAATRALLPWVRRLAAGADRGLAADLEDGALVVRWPEARGRGAVRAVSDGGASDLLERRPGLFRGPLPPGAATGVRVQAGTLSRPLRLPSRPGPEHRGSGVDASALEALAEAGGGRRLVPGEQPPLRPSGSGPTLAPWFLLAACILLVLDRLLARPDRLARNP